MKIVTHNGHFHTDELLAVAALLLKYPDAEVIRSRDEKVIDTADIVVDIGQVYDGIARFDHHQTAGAGARANGIPYASLGLVWKKFGEELAGGIEEARIIEEKLVMPIDASDNGVDLCMPVIPSVYEYRIEDYFESFASQAATIEDYDRIFFEVLPLAQGLIKREIGDAQCTVKGWQETKKIYQESENKSIIVLPRHVQWKGALVSTNALFVVYPRPDGRWASQAIPKNLHAFESKKNFPFSWAGLKDGELADITGVADALFCHRGRFLVVAQTREGAIRLAEKALNS